MTRRTSVMILTMLIASSLGACAREQAPERDLSAVTPAPAVSPVVVAPTEAPTPRSAPKVEAQAPAPVATPETEVPADPETSSGASGLRADGLGVDGLPEVEMGEPLRSSVLASMPGYEPLVDPEADAVATGRRTVGPIDLELTGGADSAEELVIAVLEAVRAGDYAGLVALMITRDEYERICWPEFPESRPVTGWTAADAWATFERSNLAGARRGLGDHQGEALALERLEWRTGRADYANFDLYLDLRIHAQSGSGEAQVLDFVRSLVVRNGRWKVFAFDD